MLSTKKKCHHKNKRYIWFEKSLKSAVRYVKKNNKPKSLITGINEKCKQIPNHSIQMKSKWMISKCNCQLIES